MFQSFSISIKTLIICFVMLMAVQTSYAQDPPPEETTAMDSPAPNETSGARVHGVFQEPPVGANGQQELNAEGEPVGPSNGGMPPPPAMSSGDAPSAPSSSGGEMESLGMELPAISAKTYELKVVRPSHTKKMVLFSKATSGMPDLGRVFLLRQGLKPVMGFRVVKVYPEKGEVAARRIKEYPDFPDLELDQTYKAFEKVGLITNIPENTPDDLLELNELEGGGSGAKGSARNKSNNQETDPGALASYGATASSGNGKAPPDSLADDDEDGNSEENDSEEDSEGGAAQNFFGFDVGSFRGKNLPGGTSGTGFGIAYSRLLSSSGRGGFALELTAGYYKSSGDVVHRGKTTATSESFTVTPLGARIRYHFGMAADKWSYYLYGGILYNRVTAQFGATDDELALAQTVVVGLGGGVLIPTGPNWYVRVNAGTDWLGLGIALRF